MIDIHSHILPGIDDGSKNLEMTLEMIKMSIKDGVTDIVATPHYCRGYGEECYESVKTFVEELKEKLAEENLNIKVHYGQEVYYSEYLLDDLEEGTIGTINESRYLLMEMSMKEYEKSILDTIYELKLKGIVPIMAHPERYSYFQKHPRMINELIREGCLFQMNLASITGRHGEKAKETAIKFLENNIYSFVGSDGHNKTTRTTEVKQAIDNLKKIDKNFVERVRENSQQILNNEEVTFSGKEIEKEKKKKKKFIFF